MRDFRRRVESLAAVGRQVGRDGGYTIGCGAEDGEPAGVCTRCAHALRKGTVLDVSGVVVSESTRLLRRFLARNACLLLRAVPVHLIFEGAVCALLAARALAVEERPHGECPHRNARRKGEYLRGDACAAGRRRTFCRTG